LPHWQGFSLHRPPGALKPLPPYVYSGFGGVYGKTDEKLRFSFPASYAGRAAGASSGRKTSHKRLCRLRESALHFVTIS